MTALYRHSHPDTVSIIQPLLGTSHHHAYNKQTILGHNKAADAFWGKQEEKVQDIKRNIENRDIAEF